MFFNEYHRVLNGRVILFFIVFRNQFMNNILFNNLMISLKVCYRVMKNNNSIKDEIKYHYVFHFNESIFQNKVSINRLNDQND